MIYPWMTSNSLIESIKRKIAVPLSQNTFTALDLLAFSNEEMFISQVPTILQFHSEYFVTYAVLRVQTNVSRYPIPDRCIGMKVRDVFWMDDQGNMYEMTQVDEHDRAYYQRNTGANQTIHKFYFEGNDVVLTPGVVSAPTGSLVFVYYLRPNQLVKDERAAIINNFQQNFSVDNSLINPLDTLTISPLSGPFTPAGQTIFTAVNTLGGTITAIAFYSTAETLITSANHQLTDGQTVIISGSNSNPVANGTYVVSVISPDTFTIPLQIGTGGSAGSFTSPNQFEIAGTSALTAANLSSAISSLNIVDSSMSVSNVITINFPNIYTNISTSNTLGFLINTATIGINFTNLPNSFTDPETNVTDTLFTSGSVVDFLQTRPGHKTYKYDVKIPQSAISGLVLTLPIDELMVPTGTTNTNNTPTIQYMLAPLVPGDYMCLANEAIIPQIPPDLHNGLAERTSARILASLGDQAGLAASNAKIQEIDSRQGNLMANRSDGNPQKVAARHSHLRYGKSGFFTRRG